MKSSKLFITLHKMLAYFILRISTIQNPYTMQLYFKQINLDMGKGVIAILVVRFSELPTTPL